MALVEDKGMINNRSAAYQGRSAPISGAGLGKRASRARYWSAILITMIIVPMVVVLGFYAVIPAKAAGPLPVTLGTAGDFTILAKSGISTTGTTQIWGDIGVSPIDSTAITGFPLTMDSSNQFSTSPNVIGDVYAVDYAPPTPTKMTTAVSNMETAYTDAAGRTNPDATGWGAGDITNLVIPPGLYKWSTGVLLSADVTLSGGASGVWIFQIAQDLTIANGAAVILAGGADPANIFWQVAGEVTLGTTSVMKGIILCQTDIAMATGASLEGKALAQTAVTMDANTVYTPGTVIPIPEFSQVLIPLVGMMFVVAMAGIVRNQRK